MPFVLTVLVVAVALSYVRGGRLTRIGDAAIRWPWAVVVGLGLQVVLDLAAQRYAIDATWTWVGSLASQLVVVGFVVANLRWPGMAAIGTGLALNAVVIAANGAMPVDPAAIRALGFDGPVALPPGRYTVVDGGTRLPWLGDVFPVPWLRSIVSPGDLILALGLLPFVHALLLGRPRRPEGVDRPDVERSEDDLPEDPDR